MVTDLDQERRVATLQAGELDYFTEPRSETTVQLLDVLAEAPATGATRAHGEIAVTTTVTGFRKVRWFTHENLGEGQVLLPPQELHTTGYWLALDDATVERLRALGLWSNDANAYGADWAAQRDAARRRDGYRCVLCGVAEAGAAHHVHHRQPFRTFATASEANDLANLVTLCPGCHRRVEVAVRVRSGLSGLAHVLGHLAPLFLMCDSRDVGVHSDPQLVLARGPARRGDLRPGAGGHRLRRAALRDPRRAGGPGAGAGDRVPLRGGLPGLRGSGGRERRRRQGGDPGDPGGAGAAGAGGRRHRRARGPRARSVGTCD